METQSNKTQAIQTLKKGDFFKKKGQKQVLVYNGYCRINKAYEYNKFDDINAYGYIKKGVLVEVDFTF